MPGDFDLAAGEELRARRGRDRQVTDYQVHAQGLVDLGHQGVQVPGRAVIELDLLQRVVEVRRVAAEEKVAGGDLVIAVGQADAEAGVLGRAVVEDAAHHDIGGLDAGLELQGIERARAEVVGALQQAVLAVAAAKEVGVGTVAATDRVVAGAAVDRVVAVLAVDAVVATAALDRVIARAGRDAVVAGAAVDGLRPAGAGDAVGLRRAGVDAGDDVGQGPEAAVGELDALQRVVGAVGVVALEEGVDGQLVAGIAVGHFQRRIAVGALVEHAAQLDLGRVHAVLEQQGVGFAGVVASAGQRVLPVAQAQHEGVVAGAELEVVIAGAAVQAVVAGLAVEQVIAGAALETVVAAPAADRVVAGAAVQGVVAGRADQGLACTGGRVEHGQQLAGGEQAAVVQAQLLHRVVGVGGAVAFEEVVDEQPVAGAGNADLQRGVARALRIERTSQCQVGQDDAGA